jgi:ABC-type Fe3+-hydroxamate transport system substrate-binding protein
LLETFGFRNVFRPADGRYPETNLETIARRKAEVVFLPNERYAFGEPDRKEVDVFLAEKGRRARVLIVEGSHLSWFGYRTLQGLRLLEQLKAKLLPETHS